MKKKTNSGRKQQIYKKYINACQHVEQKREKKKEIEKEIGNTG